MINAKTELLDHIENKSEVKHVHIYRDGCFVEPEDEINLNGSLLSVIDSLDFEYDGGYGSQELFGTVWYADGSWSERSEYDGSEWWCHLTCPTMPVEFELKPIEGSPLNSYQFSSIPL